MITTLIDQIIDDGRNMSDHTAIRESSGSTISYGMLTDSIRSTTSGLIEAGMSIGDTVLLASKPSIETLILAISIVRAGGQLVPFSPYGGQALVHARLAALKPEWVVSNSTIFLASRVGLIRNFLARRGISLPIFTNLQNCIFIRIGRNWPGTPRSISYSRLRCAHEYKRLPDVPPGNPSIAVFTSGTTADPKAVLHTNRSSGESIRITSSLLELSKFDVVYTDALHSLFPALVSGATVYLGQRTGASTERWVESVCQSAATVLFTTPSQIQDAVDHLQSTGGRFPISVKKIILGSAPVHPALLQELRSSVAEDVVINSVYAMTEILPVALVSAHRKLEFSGKGDLIGTPLPEIELRLAEDSELILSGPHLFDRYVNSEPVRDHRTGDLARMLDTGEIVLIGRKKDMIIRKGENIYPSLYEPTINAIPGVRRCAIIGIPNADERDERVIYAIEPTSDVSSVGIRKKVSREIVSGKYSIDRLAHPDAIVPIDIPISGRSGKIDREELKARVGVMLPCESQ
jgi:acyl-CoA synthetase (AMP-forming)/AMP-acid ligase II